MNLSGLITCYIQQVVHSDPMWHIYTKYQLFQSIVCLYFLIITYKTEYEEMCYKDRTMMVPQKAYVYVCLANRKFNLKSHILHSYYRAVPSTTFLFKYISNVNL